MYRLSAILHNDPNPGIFKTDKNLTKFFTLTCVSVHPCNIHSHYNSSFTPKSLSH